MGSDLFEEGCDVYLSFNKEDPNRYIADFAGKALLLEGVELKQQQMKAINKCRVAILLLSTHYLSSNWCLEELVRILRCRQKWGIIVVPIFYHLDPSHLRKLTGVAAMALSKQKVGGFWWKRWKSALKQASDLCGWDSSTHQSESYFLGGVVQDIRNKRIPLNLKISIYPIGYDVCSDYLNLFLQVGSDDVIVVGIYGESQMGKTVIAKAVYDQTRHAFEGSSFLRNVGAKSKKPNGILGLQEKLVHDVVPLENKNNITSPTQGVELIKRKLSHKRVLIVVDDVDDLDQLLHLLEIEIGLVWEEIWEPFQESRRRIVGLKEYMQSFYYLTNEKVKYLEDVLERERKKGAIQAEMISELKQGGVSNFLYPPPQISLWSWRPWDWRRLVIITFQEHHTPPSHSSRLILNVETLKMESLSVPTICNLSKNSMITH
ncbi:hypothetical protein FNV43_RR02530 [Rhamnella rubrinervis]|uniref:TIR domain-containing protein n=1 Tax=Rhamnella rubrinervis TaxID=2594499 RepID=A0A8K0HSC1_9ROSA|nr:hypothetical protein FNV43_RR02530 [Rhamnella rubrinervis]